MNSFTLGFLSGTGLMIIFAIYHMYKLDNENKELKRKLNLKVWLEEREIGGN